MKKMIITFSFVIFAVSFCYSQDYEQRSFQDTGSMFRFINNLGLDMGKIHIMREPDILIGNTFIPGGYEIIYSLSDISVIPESLATYHIRQMELKPPEPGGYSCNLCGFKSEEDRSPSSVRRSFEDIKRHVISNHKNELIKILRSHD